MEAKDIIAIFIATLSLFVSVYALYLQHSQHNERLKVKGSFGFLAAQGDLSESMVLLEASNIGHRSITISSFGLEMPNKKVMLFPYRQQHISLPHELLAGKSCTMFMPLIEIARALAREGVPESAKIIPQFSTQSGKIFSGKPIKVKNLLAWVKSV